MLFIATFSVVLLLVATVATIIVGKNPVDSNYQSEKNGNMSRLLWIYLVLFVLTTGVIMTFMFL